MSSAFILDCSLAMTWCFEDEATSATDALQEQIFSGATALVAQHWHLEVCNSLIVAERKKRITRLQSTQFLQLLEAGNIVTDSETVIKAFSATITLAREYGLSTYDAAYLELALREKIPLGSLDQALIRAANLCGVEVLPA